MTFLSILRVAAMLRRCAKGIERSNELAEERLRLEHPEWARQMAYRKKVGKTSGKVVTFGTMDVEAINDRWRETHPEEA